MELLRSEVKLLLLRNKQLENENLILKNNEILLKNNLSNQKELNLVLENIKSAQNEYISKLNNLLTELTQQNSREDEYLIIKRDIDECIQVCQQLQYDYENCKQDTNDNRFNPSEGLIREKLFWRHNRSSNLSQIDSGQVEENLDSDERFDQHSHEHLDQVIELEEEQVDHEEHNEEEDEDSDPNGAGEQYLDLNDKEFIPKRSLARNARKSMSICMSSKLAKAAKKGYKSSEKCGDKFRCNWKGCCFISSYKQNVERHYRVHTGERPFKCLFKGCGFSASQAGNLKVHQQRHGHHCGNSKIRAKSSNASLKSSNSKNSK